MFIRRVWLNENKAKKERSVLNDQKVLREPFNLDTHKKTFINYLEVVITEDGTIVYAVPSHQEMLISITRQKLNVTREELYRLCPEEYYFDLMEWLCKESGCIAVWNEHMVGKANGNQQRIIKILVEEELYRGPILV